MNHDQLFKDLLSCYFLEFLELFAPEVLAHCKPSSLAFVDKEVFADLPDGQRGEADLCARLQVRGQQHLFLLHVEHEAQYRRGFGERMLHYHARLYARYRCPIYPLALLSFARPRKPQPDTYRINFPDLRPIEFRYRVIQLNLLNWRDFLAHRNPAAAALMTRMNIASRDRPHVKLECMRILVNLKLEPSRLRFLASFVDQYLRLTAEETGIFQRELEQSDMQAKERRTMMELTTSWELKGREEGLRQAILRQVRRRFGNDAQNLLHDIEAESDTDRLNRLLDALVSQAELDELHRLLGE